MATKRKPKRATRTCRKHGQTTVAGRSKAARSKAAVGLNRCRWKPAAKRRAAPKRATKANAWRPVPAPFNQFTAMDWAHIRQTVQKQKASWNYDDESPRGVIMTSIGYVDVGVDHEDEDGYVVIRGVYLPASEWPRARKVPTKKNGAKRTKPNHHGGYHAPGDPLGYRANPPFAVKILSDRQGKIGNLIVRRVKVLAHDPGRSGRGDPTTQRTHEIVTDGYYNMGGGYFTDVWSLPEPPEVQQAIFDAIRARRGSRRR